MTQVQTSRDFWVKWDGRQLKRGDMNEMLNDMMNIIMALESKVNAPAPKPPSLSPLGSGIASAANLNQIRQSLQLSQQDTRSTKAKQSVQKNAKEAV